MKNCVDCILDGTDACSRGAGRAVDDKACKDFLGRQLALDRYDTCYYTGNYMDDDCGFCPHSAECSAFHDEDDVFPWQEGEE